MSRRWPRTADEGQATVEFALGLPLIVLAMLFVVQVGLVVRDQVRTLHAAREGARSAAVDTRTDAARRAALDGAGFAGGRTEVRVSGRGGAGTRVTVFVAYRAATDVPLVGALLPDIEVRGDATMRVER